jgi:hypothetical protein
MANTVDDSEYEEIFRRVGDWQARWKKTRRPYLRYQKSWSTIRISDGRGEKPRTYIVSDEPAALYEYCAEARTPRDIAARFGGGPQIQNALKEFVEKDLMLHLDGRYLSLALPENPYFDLADVPDHHSAEMEPERTRRETPIQIS